MAQPAGSTSHLLRPTCNQQYAYARGTRTRARGLPRAETIHARRPRQVPANPQTGCKQTPDNRVAVWSLLAA
eukprot:8193800-Lingulodinium_polyedra.AAC.1